MQLAQTFAQAESEVKQMMKQAIDAGNFSKLQSLLALQRICEDGKQISGRLEGVASTPVPLGSAKVVSEGPQAGASSASRAMSKKARGEMARRSWIQGCKLHLRHVKNRLYQTPSGSSVGIASATENEDKRPDRWWLGLPDQSYDVVVLLCEKSDGVVLDFVLPRSFLAPVWSGLTRSGGQVEFHVEQSGATVNFRTPGGWLSITSYLGNHSVLY
jgi:hypothetical protein